MFGPNPGPLTLKVDLFTNQANAGEYATMDDFDLASFPGYSPILIGSGAMQAPVVVAGYIECAPQMTPIMWPNLGNVPAYLWGVVVSSLATGNVICSIQFIEAFQLNPNVTFQYALVFIVAL